MLLHSRRFASGAYLRSAYSFIYETADETKHGNDVQLVFDNSGDGNEISINMVTNQQNLVTDLGDVDFEKNYDPKTIDVTAESTWLGTSKLLGTP